MTTLEATVAQIHAWADAHAPGIETVCPFLNSRVLMAEHTEITALNALPYGLQFNRVVSQGSGAGEYVSHVSRPGATVTAVSKAEVLLQQEYRPELGRKILKFAGGFAPNPAVAKEIVDGYRLLAALDWDTQEEVATELLSDGSQNLRNHLLQLMEREFGVRFDAHHMALVERPVGYPAIFITSVMAVVRVHEPDWRALVGHLPQADSSNMSRIAAMEGPFRVPFSHMTLSDLRSNFGDENSRILAQFLANNAPLS